MRLIDADKLIEQLYQDSPDPEGVDDWVKIINAQPTEEQTECDKCEVGNPCLYCEHEFKDKRIEQMCKDCIHAEVHGANSMKCNLRDEVVFNDGRCNSFKCK